MIIRLIVEATYARAIKSLPPNRAKSANTALMKFAQHLGAPGLDFRLLKGRKGYRLIDSGPGDRIVLRKDADDIYAAVDVGPHDNILRRWNR